MNTSITKRTSRFLLPLAVAAAIVGGALVGTLHSNNADAALKWREHVVKWNVSDASNGHDNNKDGLKFVDPTPAPSSDATADSTTTP